MDISPSFQETPSTILCCMCGTPMQSNPANTCVNCIRSQIDITEGIPKSVMIHFCRNCGRYLQPPNYWVTAALESRELLTFCLKRLKGLNKVKLVDAVFVWTEPHSKRLKVKVTVQQEVYANTILQQVFVVEYVVANQMCTDCHRVEADLTWVASAQVRQKVNHKRTFYFLEQLILKHDVHSQCSGVKEFRNGLDFYFGHRGHAVKFVEFLAQAAPIRYKTAKELISNDTKSNVANYKFTFSVEIAPICKDDLLCLPRKLAASLGNIFPLVLCRRVSNMFHLVNPFTLQTAELHAPVYWRDPFRSIADKEQLASFIVLDISPIRGASHGKMQLAEALVAREADLGFNDTQFLVKTHLGNILHAGDTVMGFDLGRTNFNDADLKALRGYDLPEIVLVRKAYPVRRSQKKKRVWKLKSLTKEQGEERRMDVEKDMRDYESFMQDLEEDPEMRANIDLYRDDNASVASDEQTDEEGFPEVRLDELIDEMEAMTVDD